MDRTGEPPSRRDQALRLADASTAHGSGLHASSPLSDLPATLKALQASSVALPPHPEQIYFPRKMSPTLQPGHFTIR